MCLLSYSDELSTARDRLLNGLNKLSETNTLVEQMKAQLAQLAPVLEVKAKATQVSCVLCPLICTAIPRHTWSANTSCY